MRRGKNTRGLRTHQLLLEAAVDCFSEHGFAGTRVSDIVFRAGVSQGNFYRHFQSKSAVLLEALSPALADLSAATSRRQVGDGVDLATLTTLTTAFFTTYARHRRILRVMHEAAASSVNDGFAEVWLERRRAFMARTAQWLRRTQSQGRTAVENIDTIAEILGSAIEQTAYVQIGLPAQAPRTEVIQELALGMAQVWQRAILVVDEVRPEGPAPAASAPRG